MDVIKQRGWKVFWSVLLSFLFLAGLVIPTLAAMEQKGRILSFEKESPVYIGAVAQGTKRDELGLPETLRATIETQDIVKNSRGGGYI